MRRANLLEAAMLEIGWDHTFSGTWIGAATRRAAAVVSFLRFSPIFEVFFFLPPSGYIIRTQLLHWRALDGCLYFYRAKCAAMLLLIVIRIPGRLDFLSREAWAICTEEARHSLRCSPEDSETIHRRWWFQMLRLVALDRSLLWLFPFPLFLCFASLCFSQTEGLLSCLLGALNLASASNLYFFNPAARSTSFVLPPPWLLKCQGNDVKACLEAQANKLISMCH